MADEPTRPRPAAPEAQAASTRIAGILSAAEQSAREIRDGAEARADARIAEADRAAALRVEAAEQEARELLAQARADAQAAVRGIHEDAAAERALATDEAARVVREATAQADGLLRDARQEARDIIGEAHASARQALHEGEELSSDLRDLSGSLRTNAERLLRDIKLAHARMVAGLDQAAPADPGRTPSRTRRSEDFSAEVPEFLSDR